MNKFIELTILKKHPDSTSRYEAKMLINTSEIVGVSESEEHTGSYIELKGTGKEVLAAFAIETYEEVKEMLSPNVISSDVGDVL